MVFKKAARLVQPAGGQDDDQAAKALVADFLDRAGKDIDADAAFGGQARQHRVGGVAAGEGDLHHRLGLYALRGVAQLAGDELRHRDPGDALQERAGGGVGRA